MSETENKARSTARVFFIQRNPRFDVTDAENFGEITYLFSEDFPIHPFNMKEALRAMSDRLEAEKFNPTNDFVAVTGPNMLLNFFCITVAMKYVGNPITWLLYDQRKMEYVDRVVNPAQALMWAVG